MATAPINKPQLVSSAKSWSQTRAMKSDGSNTFETQQFVKLSSGNLTANVTGDTVTYGLTVTDSKTSTEVLDNPQSAPFGEQQGVIDPELATFLVNITDSASNIGSGSTTQADVTVGTAYGIIIPTAGTYSGVAFLNRSETSNTFFRVEQLWAEDATTDFNGRVVCRVVATRQ